jgi:hypothetical protein
MNLFSRAIRRFADTVDTKPQTPGPDPLMRQTNESDDARYTNKFGSVTAARYAPRASGPDPLAVDPRFVTTPNTKLLQGDLTSRMPSRRMSTVTVQPEIPTGSGDSSRLGAPVVSMGASLPTPGRGDLPYGTSPSSRGAVPVIRDGSDEQ